MPAFETSPPPSRLSPTETTTLDVDLNFLAKPENYTGSSMVSMQRIIRDVKSAPPGEKLGGTGDSADDSSRSSLSRIYARYKGYCDDNEQTQPSRQLSVTASDGGDTRGDERRMRQPMLSVPAIARRGQSKLAIETSGGLGDAKPDGFQNKHLFTPTRRRRRASNADSQCSDHLDRFATESSGGLGDTKPDGFQTKHLFAPARRRPSNADSQCSDHLDKFTTEISGGLRDTKPDGFQAKHLFAPARRRPSNADSQCSDHSDGAATVRLSARTKISTRGGRRSSCHSSVSNLLIEDTSLAARDRFRHSTRIILILLKWISSLSEKGDSEGGDGGGRTFTDIANEAFTSDELRNSGLSFDLSKFKAKREVNINSEVKLILSLPSHQRSNEQIQTALIGLQHMKSFAEYPLHMQEKLCRVAWFQQVPPKKVVIRQGHYAENFYFILSGQAVVRILDKNQKTGESQLRTATVMRKGTSFGELALLHHSRRTATVVSQDVVQLLAIGRDDFFDIFMSGSGPDGIPEHIRFVTQLDFMKDWPTKKLLENPETCLFHFYKRGVVIVKDSEDSDWLYIIKSGSCQVMKELKGVKTNLATRKRQPERHSTTVMLPRLGTGEFSSKVDTGRHRRSRSSLTPNYTNSSRSRPKREATRGQAWDDDHDVKAPRDQPKEKITPVLMTAPPQPDTPGYSKSKFHKFPRSRNGRLPHPKRPASLPPGQPPPSSGQSGGSLSPRSMSLTPGGVSPRAKTAKRDRDTEIPTELRGPVFVQVEVLKPKDTFGLNTIQFDDDIEAEQTSVSLVSNGAECIMLSKRFFSLHANEKVKRRIRYQVRPYPAEDALQQNLQTKVDWDIYKKKLIKDMLAQKAREMMLMSSTKT